MVHVTVEVMDRMNYIELYYGKPCCSGASKKVRDANKCRWNCKDKMRRY